jgi:phage shock protein A
VTYNFDPEKWSAKQRAALERQRDEGSLGAEAFARALAELDARFEELVGRLDAEFVVPHEPAGR